MRRKPLKIGNLEFEYPFVLAPLAGITDRSMRSLCCKAGASLTYTEMVSGKGLWYGDRKTGDLLKISREEGPVGYQLFGSEPDVLGYAVRVLSDPSCAKAVDAQMLARFGTTAEATAAESSAGADSPLKTAAIRPPIGARTVAGLTPPVLFDLNAGCPVPKIVRNGEGSALLKDPDLVYDCISAMCSAAREAATNRRNAATVNRRNAAMVNRRNAASGTGADEAAKPIPVTEDPMPIPVTVKIRKGFHRGDETAVEIAKAAEAAGAAAVTVHGRTREQYYDGRADWDIIRKVKEAVRIPVIGNGDVMCGADAIHMMEVTGCDGVMIARGALGNPWIFTEARILYDEATGTDKISGAEPNSIQIFSGTPDTVSIERSIFNPPTDQERINMLMHHIDLVCEDKGERTAVREMRKFVGWYIKGMRGAAQIRRQINAINDAEEMKQVLAAFAAV